MIRCRKSVLESESYLFTHSMEKSPSGEADWFSASQEIPRILWNLKVHYHFYLPLFWARSTKSMPPSQPTFWRSILILSSHLCVGLPSSLFPSGFSTKNLDASLLSPTHATCPAHLILLDLITQIIFGGHYRSSNEPKPWWW